jgi:electron transfer flavoprotein beta subunit
MKIVVLIKQVPDTDEGMGLDVSTGLLERQKNELIPDEINERALAVALSYKDAHKDTEVVVLSMGPDAAGKALQKGLQCGADSAIHITDPELSGSDALRTATVLAAALKTMSFDLVITGNASSDGNGGVVPAMVSEFLGLPLLGAVHSIRISADSISAEREEGRSRTSIRSAIPALISVTERSAEPRFPTFKGIISAKRKKVTSLSLADLRDVEGSHSAVLSVNKRPERMAGVKIFDDGDAGTQLAAFLASSQLI